MPGRPAGPGMLAFDIETTSLEPAPGRVTCICACDPDAGVELTILTAVGEDPEPFFQLLDDAERICAFNGARFDIPFLQVAYGVPNARAGGWMLKLVDLYEATYQAFGRAFSLNRLLAANGLDAKIDSGGNAIRLAQEQDWGALTRYCMDDTRKTHAVSSLPRLVLPLRGLTAVFRVGGRFLLA